MGGCRKCRDGVAHSVPHGKVTGYGYHGCRCDLCRAANAAQKRAYREANRDKVAAQKRAYYEANRDKVAAQQRAYYEANRDKVAARQRAYREANRDKVAARQCSRCGIDYSHPCIDCHDSEGAAS